MTTERNIMRQWRKVNLDSLVSGYVEAALWSSSIMGQAEDGSDDLENGDGLSFSNDGLSRMRSRVARTLASLDNRRLYRLATLHPIKRDSLSARIVGMGLSYTANQFGHDLWLTENGHGSGFWDRDELDFTLPGWTDTLGDMLSDAVRYREGYLYTTNETDAHGCPLVSID